MPGNHAFVPVGVGFIVDVTIPDPGTNVQYTYMFPVGYLYKMELLCYTFEADFNAADRISFVDLFDGAMNLRSSNSELRNVIANQVVHFSCCPSFTRSSTTDNYREVPLPDIWIPGGWLLRSHTDNMQFGDRYINILLTAARYRAQN